MKSLLLGAAAAALSLGSASAQTLTADQLRAMPQDDLKAYVQGLEFEGYRIEPDECGQAACDASGMSFVGFILNAFDRLSPSQDETGANAPRIDANADGTVDFAGQGYFLRRFRTGIQTIYLDFDNEGSPDYPVDLVLVDPTAPPGQQETPAGQLIFQDYVFTAEDRAIIRDRVAADYERFGIEVVTEEPASGEFARIDFTDNDRPEGDANITLFVFPDNSASVSILFGRADNIDFGNDNFSTNAFTDANFWQVITQVFGPGFFEAQTGLPADPEGIREATLSQASNTGSHEAAHGLGLRHHDSFGAPGNGLPTTGIPAPGTFVPAYEGPQAADETLLHLMATGASVGLPLNGGVVLDRFLSERSALKLALNEFGFVYAEPELFGSFFTSAKRVFLRPTLVPNTLEEGLNANEGGFLYMKTAWIQGTLDGAGDTDEYVFYADGAQTLSAELISFSDLNVVNPVIATVNLYKSSWDGSRELVSSNAQTFEPFDPLLVDIALPSAGDYVIEVVPQDTVFFPNGDGTFEPFDLAANGLGDLLQGDYDLLVYQVKKPFGDATTAARVEALLAKLGD